MSTLNNRLQLALLKRKRSGNALQKGFTLVELMIVIVIVGILSAVALPNFLNQTGKAKATEAQTKISAALKSTGAEYHSGAITANSAAGANGPCGPFIPNNLNNWTYTNTSCTSTNATFTGTNSTDFGSQTATVTGTIDSETGEITTKPALSLS